MIFRPQLTVEAISREHLMGKTGHSQPRKYMAKASEPLDKPMILHSGFMEGFALRSSSSLRSSDDDGGGQHNAR